MLGAKTIFLDIPGGGANSISTHFGFVAIPLKKLYQEISIILLEKND